MIQPYTNCQHSGSEADYQAGLKLISEGKVGCILIAGGQGTRLQVNGPKGMVAVTPIRHKSLFQLFCEKVIAAGKQARRLLNIAIMTSPLNHEDTVLFFEAHQYFGLHKEQVQFFTQGMLPFRDMDGEVVRENASKAAEGPDGNGSSLEHFVNSGIWQDWYDKGIRYINYCLIDNALADPYDAELVGFHARMNVDVTLKCTEKAYPEEKVGLLALKEGKLRVVEYTEIAPEESIAVDSQGRLKYRYANLSLFCFSMDFIKQCSKKVMPLHKNLKSISSQDTRKVWKFEKFIFDILNFTNKMAALCYPKELCFAPLKNLTGSDTIDDVHKALYKQAQLVYAQVSKTPVSNKLFELSPEFLYPTTALKQQWHGKPVTSTYIGDL